MKLSFEKVFFHNLVEGNKYYIIFNDLISMRYIGMFKGFKGNKVINAQFINVSILFPGHLLENKKETNFFWSNNSNRHYYKPILRKHIIQTRMEKRALDIILRRIIGDDHFTWY